MRCLVRVQGGVCLVRCACVLFRRKVAFLQFRWIERSWRLQPSESESKLDSGHRAAHQSSRAMRIRLCTSLVDWCAPSLLLILVQYPLGVIHLRSSRSFNYARSRSMRDLEGGAQSLVSLDTVRSCSIVSLNHRSKFGSTADKSLRCD
jgi:hypothetical protein